MTKTKTKNSERPALPDWQTEMSEELDRADQRRRAAWSIMLTAADGDALTHEQLDFLRAVGIDDATRRREIGKLGRMLQVYRRAGTRAEREAAAKRLAELEETVGGKVRQMQDEIARLQAEVQNANQLLDQTRSEVERQAKAAEELQSEAMLPEWVRGQLADIRKAESSCEAAGVIREGEARKRMIEGVLKISDRREMVLHAQGTKFNGESLLMTVGDGGKMISPEVNPAAWGRYLEALRAELPELDAKMAEADRELDCFRREAAELRGYWLNDEVEEQLKGMEVLS